MSQAVEDKKGAGDSTGEEGDAKSAGKLDRNTKNEVKSAGKSKGYYARTFCCMIWLQACILLFLGDAVYVGIAKFGGLFWRDEHKHRVSRRRDSLPAEDSYGKYSRRRPQSPFAPTPRTSPRHVTRANQLSDSGPSYSTFHNTPERKQVSKEKWEKFTKESTKKALEGLVYSPDFSKWAVAHADRITLRPKSQDDREQPRRWFSWF